MGLQPSQPGGGIGFLGRGDSRRRRRRRRWPAPVRLFANREGEAIYDFFAYDINFTGGVHVAVADLNGDGVPDLVVTGPGMPALVRVFDGRTMRLLSEFLAFEPKWTGGVFVAAADRTRDGRSWIVVGADNGAAARQSLRSQFGKGNRQLLRLRRASPRRRAGGAR